MPFVAATSPAPALDLPERAEEHVRDRAVHRPAHHQREQRARRADEHAADDQHVVLELEPGRGGREPRERVQERDDDRHVGAADRQDEEDPEQRRAGEDDREQPALLGAGDDRDAGSGDDREQEPVHDLLAGIGDRAAADQLLELRERDHRAGERDRADQRRQDERDRDVALQIARERRLAVELRPRDESRCAAADAVEQRHHLRHRGHLHAARRDRAERAADHHRDDHPEVVVQPVLAERRRDRERHPGRADPTPRRARAGFERSRSAQMKVTIVTR